MIFRIFSSGSEDSTPPEAAVCRALRAAGARCELNGQGEPVSIEIDHTADDQFLADVAECPGLEQLTLNWCYSVTDDGLNALAGLRSLTKLALPGANVNGEFLSAFQNHPALEWLELDGSGVLDDSLRWIAGIPKLTSLFLRYTAITDHGVDLLAAAEQLEVLHLDGTPTTGASLPALRKLRRLQVLSLSAGIRSEDLQHLAGLGRLRWVWLSDAVVDEASVQMLKETLNPMCSVGWRRKRN